MKSSITRLGIRPWDVWDPSKCIIPDVYTKYGYGDLPKAEEREKELNENRRYRRFRDRDDDECRAERWGSSHISEVSLFFLLVKRFSLHSKRVTLPQVSASLMSPTQQQEKTPCLSLCSLTCVACGSDMCTSFLVMVTSKLLKAKETADIRKPCYSCFTVPFFDIFPYAFLVCCIFWPFWANLTADRSNVAICRGFDIV